MHTRYYREPSWHRFCRLNHEAIGQVLGGGLAGAVLALMVWMGIGQ